MCFSRLGGRSRVSPQEGIDSTDAQGSMRDVPRPRDVVRLPCDVVSFQDALAIKPQHALGDPQSPHWERSPRSADKNRFTV